jgi:AraC family L-rhamnose operon transcriptional activator RhaR/AraC family L-rhamnose operon regulatory protein RhaS
MEIFQTYDYSAELPLAVICVSGLKTLAAMHSHQFHELAVVVSGSGSYRTANATFKLHPGDVFMLKPGMAHEYFEQRNLVVENLIFEPERLQTHLYDLGAAPGYRAFFELEPQARGQNRGGGHLTVDGDQLEYLRGLLRRLQDELRRRQDGFLLMAVTYLAQIFTHLSRCFAASSHAPHRELLRLEQVLAYLRKHYRREITRGELAKLACMSESSLYRRFTQVLGQSPMQYLIEWRLAMAAEVLRHSNDGILDIAARCGFSDSNYFGLRFRRQYHITPHQYRLQAGQKK